MGECGPAMPLVRLSSLFFGIERAYEYTISSWGDRCFPSLPACCGTYSLKSGLRSFSPWLLHHSLLSVCFHGEPLDVPQNVSLRAVYAVYGWREASGVPCRLPCVEHSGVNATLCPLHELLFGKERSRHRTSLPTYPGPHPRLHVLVSLPQEAHVASVMPVDPFPRFFRVRTDSFLFRLH